MMKEWWSKLTKQQKIIGGAAAAAVIVAAVVLIVIFAGKGREDSDETAARTNEAGETIAGEEGSLQGQTEEEGSQQETEESRIGLDTIPSKAGEGDENYVKPSNPVPSETEEGTIRVTNAAGEYIQDVVADRVVTPGADTLKEEDIKNYEPVETVVDENNDKVAEDSLKVVSVGKYTGVFVENGEDLYLENVASMLVTNTTDQMIQVARFTMEVNGNPDDVALFQVTDLPAGASALILELNRREYAEGDVYTVGDELHTFYEDGSDMSEKFSFQTNGDLLTLTNLTDETFDIVYVHYKYVQEGGAYLGGIAYRSTFQSVGAGESVTTSVTHYTDRVSQIVRVDTAETAAQEE